MRIQKPSDHNGGLSLAALRHTMRLRIEPDLPREVQLVDTL